MNKGAIQKYAVWARNELITEVKQRAFQYGIKGDKSFGSEDAVTVFGRVLTDNEKSQRRSFIALIKDTSYDRAIEEVAYTWFNRFIALRFMEVNDYLPSHIRVFSGIDGKFQPEILKEALNIELDGLDKSKVRELINQNRTEDLYRYLLLTQCNALNSALPEMFERMGSYTEMLLPNNILKESGILGRLVSDIPEKDWKDAVQIIGWLYQYYNTEPKQEVFDGLKKNIKITKEKIPAATQLFTPEWIVKYMVENSLGRLWMEQGLGFRDKGIGKDKELSEQQFGWKYYLPEAEQTPEVYKNLTPNPQSLTPNFNIEDIKVLDPCMGSGHILVYAFDVFMQIYRSCGYSDRDAAKLILEKNLYGLDIDKRAHQLAYFALMMKARNYNRRIFDDNIKPQVYHPQGWADGEEYGSLAIVDNGGLVNSEQWSVDSKPKLPEAGMQMTAEDSDYEKNLRIWNFKRVLSQKYDVVVTNPPYMGASGMSPKMSQFAKDYYPDSKSDMFAMFIEFGLSIIKPQGFSSMVTMQSWMFLSSLERMRQKVLQTKTITSLMHMENMVMGIAFGTAVSVLRGIHIDNYIGRYNHIELSMIVNEIPKQFPPQGKRNVAVSADNFSKIPGSPIAYWVSKALLYVFAKGKTVEEFSLPRQGMGTGDNDRFLRIWWEVNRFKIGFEMKSLEEADVSNKKWFPYNKGGEFRKWYGNNEYLVNFQNDGKEVKASVMAKYTYLKSPDFVVKNTAYFFKECLTWSQISSGSIAFRHKPAGFITGGGAASAFISPENISYLHAACNSKVVNVIATLLSPTLNFEINQVKDYPIVEDVTKEKIVSQLVIDCIGQSKTDWDSFETSWDFKRHPLV